MGVSLQDTSDHRERCPRSSMSWADMCDVQVSTTRRPRPRTEDSEAPVAPRSVTDSTEKWVWCLMNMRSMLHVISVMCLVYDPQEEVVVFGYIEVTSERYTTNIYRCIRT